MRYTPYSQEERQFLRDNISDCGSFAELTRRLNAAFGSNRKMESVREQCNKRLHLKNGKNDGQYGKRSRTQLPVGTIRKSNNGTTYIKVADAAGQCTTGYREPAWIPLQKKIYQDAHGVVPDGYMVVFLNCDNNDFRPENLYPITRKTSARLAQNGWYSKNPELTMAAIRLCELNEVIHNG